MSYPEPYERLGKKPRKKKVLPEQDPDSYPTMDLVNRNYWTRKYSQNYQDHFIGPGSLTSLPPPHVLYEHREESGYTGYFPVVPESPPKLLPGVTMKSLLFRYNLIVAFIASVVLLIVGTGFFGERLFGESFTEEAALTGGLIGFAGAMVGYAWMIMNSNKMADIFHAEMVTGYTTQVRGWQDPRGPDGGGRLLRSSVYEDNTYYKQVGEDVPVAGAGYKTGTPIWNFAGMWVLDKNGRVLHAPDRSVDPPGHYPSPFPGEEGKFLLWTGVMWLQSFRTESELRRMQVARRGNPGGPARL